MKTRRIFVVLAAVLFLTLACVFVLRTPEPEYEGRKLSFWLEQLEENPAKATTAIRQIGSNAVPYLASELRVRDNRVKEAIRNQASFSNAFPRLALPPGVFHERAMWACRILGPEAEDALPDLVRLLGNPGQYEGTVLSTMEVIGPDAVPYFAQVLRDPDDRSARLGVTKILHRMEPQALWKHADVAAVGLVHCLTDPEWDVRNFAYATLLQLGPKGAAATGPLRRLLEDKQRLSSLGEDAPEVIDRAERVLEAITRDIGGRKGVEASEKGAVSR